MQPPPLPRTPTRFPLIGKVLVTATVLILLPFVGYVLGSATGMVKFFRAPTGSMQPTINSGDHVFAVRYRPSSADLTRGKLVVFDADGLKEPGGMILEGIWVKRIVALPGDTVSLKDGLLLVNGETVDRNELQALAPHPYPGGQRLPVFPLVVPEGTVFLLGDNFRNSLDSRYLGPISIKRIVYRPTRRISPNSQSGELQ